MAFPGLGIVLRTFWLHTSVSCTAIILGTLPRLTHHETRFCLEIYVFESVESATSSLYLPVFNPSAIHRKKAIDSAYFCLF